MQEGIKILNLLQKKGEILQYTVKMEILFVYLFNFIYLLQALKYTLLSLLTKNKNKKKWIHQDKLF